MQVLIAPRERWLAGSRWVVFVSERCGERPPSDTELRLWASVWLVLGGAVAAAGVLLGFLA